MEIMIGCDPEVFVYDNNLGEFVSGHTLIPGTKDKPFAVPFGAIQVDGTALEFNINPAKTRKEFVGNVTRVYDTLQRKISLNNNHLQLCAVPVADFREDIFANIPAENKRLGCEPDFDAYTGLANDPPDADRQFRTGSGHIHIGWTNGASVEDPDHLDVCRRVAIQLDYFIGIYSLYWDSDDRRRELYGKAGAFRPKPYGMEYRTLSNSWLREQELIAWVYDQARNAMDGLANNNELYLQYGTVAQEIINEGNREWFDTYGDLAECGLPPVTEVN